MKFLFDSVDTNLGRFGHVKKGDVLELTPHEAQSIKGDKRFKPFDEAKGKAHKPGQFVEITAAMTSDQKAAAEKANAKEKQRLEEVEKENDSRKVYVQEVREMTFAQLEIFADKLNKDAGRKIVDYHPKKTARADLANLILAVDERAAGAALDETQED